MPQVSIDPGISSGRELAQAFGWRDTDLRDKQVARGGTHLDTARGYLSGESAALFATVQTRNGFDPVDSAALYGYHIASDWGVVADRDTGITIFNSRWLVDGRWYRYPTIPWREVKRNQDILASLAPEGLVAGTTATLATKRRQPTAFLLPVDDALVERLDAWRDQALKFAKRAANVDELLQTIYAQLFVLRTVEDRRLHSAVPPVSSVIKRDGQFSQRKWASIMRDARAHIGSDLFDEDVGRDIPEHVLAGVIRDLYHPSRVPESEARYDFSWIDSDVLGLAYEKYLASVLKPSAAPAQSDLFQTPERGVERVTVRKSSGAYYTPKYITTYLAARTVDQYFESGEASPPYVIDFACGSGSFLVAAVDRVLKHLNAREPGRHWARELIDSRHIVGVDIDQKAVTAARLQLWQRLLEEPVALPLPTLGDVIVVGDGLRKETWGELARSYDIVLGNPPFLATSMVEEREGLETRFATARGRYDYSSLFVEQAVRTLSPRGQLGMVTPNRLFRNQSGAYLRELLTRDTTLLTVVDFGSTRPFDANAYVGCIVAEKRGAEGPRSDNLRVIEVLSLDTDFLANLLLRAEAGEIVDATVLRSFEARHPHGASPWILLSTAQQRSRVQLEDASVRLDTLAHIAQGIRTGANDFFIFSLQSDDGSNLCEATNGLGQTVIIEREVLEPVVYGSEVQRYTAVRGVSRLLYPYRRNIPLSESELENRFPRTWKYLLGNRDVLSARSSLQRTRGKFFELIWPRDESWLRRPKLLIRDLAPHVAFAVDETGETFLVGGTAVVPRDPQVLFALLGYLNSSVIDELVRQTTPSFRGDFQKFEPQHIQSIPVLHRLTEDENFFGQMTELARRVVHTSDEVEKLSAQQEIDEIIRSALTAQGLRLEP